ncbi:MAG: hypothetical protein KC656_10975, partial [Myxococcales bacterium]|nr:hypothetical protein [Myxococcales bacterium]
MSEHNVDIQSLLETVDAYLRTRVALYLDFHALVDVENAGQREARAISALTSPHTVALYDYGSTPDGAFFIVMELLSGIDLFHLVQRYG